MFFLYRTYPVKYVKNQRYNIFKIIKMKNTLFAIYKNNNHKGNIRANNQNEAIKKFIVA